MPGRGLRVSVNVGRRALRRVRAFFTPWTIAWLGFWTASVVTESWAWVFCFGLAWIMHFVYRFNNELDEENQKESNGLVPHSLLAGAATLGAFLMLTAWTGVVLVIAWVFGWDARPI
jgi:hypothetical protein